MQVTKYKPHDHAPDRELAEAEVVKYNLNQEKVNNPGKYPSTILRDELPRVPSGVIAHLPERHNLIRSMRQGRKASQPLAPNSLQDLQEVPEVYRRTITGDRFLLYDSRDEYSGNTKAELT